MDCFVLVLDMPMTPQTSDTDLTMGHLKILHRQVVVS
jgi:hypothetical protein